MPRVLDNLTFAGENIEQWRTTPRGDMRQAHAIAAPGLHNPADHTGGDQA
jgi:hypothetical protein